MYSCSNKIRILDSPFVIKKSLSEIVPYNKTSGGCFRFGHLESPTRDTVVDFHELALALRPILSLTLGSSDSTSSSKMSSRSPHGQSAIFHEGKFFQSRLVNCGNSTAELSK